MPALIVYDIITSQVTLIKIKKLQGRVNIPTGGIVRESAYITSARSAGANAGKTEPVKLRYQL